ncbi:MAG TPA: hypothetical protein VN256_13210 [Pyrinomonadaceae bacterium]|nr:hypothetical protein [Pyrinomonadaceae bacterium]
MATKDTGFSVKTKDLTVEVSGSAEQVQQVYQALQGVLNSMAPNVLSNGGDLALNVKGAEKKAEG